MIDPLLLPIDTINVYRNTIDRVVDIYGFSCELFIPKLQVINQRETLDVYRETPFLNEESKFQPAIETKTFIEWKPDSKRLRRFGIFTEDDLPIVGWFKNLDMLCRNSYIKIPINYIQGEWGSDEFELVDQLVKNMYNAAAVCCWRLAPRRV